MKVFGDEQQLCPCYKECQEFQKLVELKDFGLVVYCYRPRTEDIRQAEAVESAVNTTRDVFILCNKKNVKITASELTSELEKENMSCPRCRKMYEYAQELMQEVKSIDRKMIMGICDKCRKKAQGSKNLFCSCDKIVKKFMSVIGEQKEDAKKNLNHLKMSNLRKDTMVNKLKQNAYSDFLINRGFTSPARHEPEIQQMFSHTHFKSDYTELSETNLKKSYVKQAVAFIQPIELVKTSSAHTPHETGNINELIPSTSLEDSETTFVETSVGLKELARPSLKDRKQEEISEDGLLMDAKEALKRRHDLSLRQMMRREQDSVGPYSVSKIPDIYETLKIAPWAQKDPTLKYYVKSEMDIKIPTLKHYPRGTRDLEYVSNRVVKFRSTTASQHSYYEPRKSDKYHHDKIKQGFYDSKERPKKVNKNIADKDLKLHCSVDKISHKVKNLKQQHMTKSKSEPIETVGNVPEHQYSFFFPKVMEDEEKKVKIVSSSLLIKDIQEKFRLQVEREKKRQEEERQKKLEQTQKKKLVREQKILQGEEDKKRQAVEDKNKIKEEQKIFEKEQRKLDEEQKIYEEAQKKLANHKKFSEEHLESKLAVKEKKKISMVAKKHVMSKPSDRDKTDGVSGKNKMDVKVKPGDDEITEKGSKDFESGTEQKDKINEVSEKAKLEQEDEGVAKVEKLKLEKEEARKTQAAKDKGEIDAPSKTSGKQETLKIKQGKGKVLESKILKKESSIAQESSELQKLRAEHLKEKQALKNKNKLEYERKVSKVKEEAEHNSKRDKLESRRIKMRKEHSKENLKLIKYKQAAKMRPSDINSEVVKNHEFNHQHSGKKSSFCPLCVNSELELDVLSLHNKKNLTTGKTDIIKGEKIFENKPRLEKIREPEGVPLLFQKQFSVESDKQPKQIVQIIPQKSKSEQRQILLTKMEPGKGVIRYALSDRTFIDKGWTMLPTEKVVRKMNVYRMRPAHPEFDWFEHNKNKRLMTYNTGERLADFDDNGRGRWYYRNGRLALDYYDTEETNAQQRFVIYSSGEPEECGRTHPITILATFDYLGNGIVFDHAGKIRLKYNQTEGVVLDRGIGPVSHWQWHSLNDPPVLQQVMIDTHMAQKDPNILKLGSAADIKTRPDNEEMLAIEFDNFIKEKSKKLSQKFKPYQIRMKALKINEHFSLKVLDQATVYIIFRDGLTNLKLNIGMILDHQEIVDTDTVEVGKVSNSLERFPARTDSLAGLQRSVARAQRDERQYAERERWLRPPEPCASADHLTAAASPPMRLPLRTVSTESSYSSTGYKSRTYK